MTERTLISCPDCDSPVPAGTIHACPIRGPVPAPAASPPSAPLAETPREGLSSEQVQTINAHLDVIQTEVEAMRADARLGAALREALSDVQPGQWLSIFDNRDDPDSVSFGEPFGVSVVVSKIEHATDATRALATALRPTHDGKEKGE